MVTVLHDDLKQLVTQPTPGISACPEDSMYSWVATIAGPPGSFYTGKEFKLKIKFSDNHPIKPPRVVFTSGCFHPNVSLKGEICLDTLGSGWSPAISVRALLLSIQSLLDEPNPDHPLNPEAAHLYKEDPARFQTYVNAFAKKSLS